MSSPQFCGNSKRRDGTEENRANEQGKGGAPIINAPPEEKVQ
jgi:hypothetical protein